MKSTTTSGTIRDNTLDVGVPVVQRPSPRKKGSGYGHDDNFARYYNDVGRTEILNAATERQLFKLYRKSKDRVARDKIVEGCLRFVVKLAHQYTSDLDQLKDLISAGNVGLLVAIDRFDPDRGTRFLSYATHWVLLHIRGELQSDSLVSMPLWRQKAVRRIRRLKSTSNTQKGIDPTDEEICYEADLSSSQLQKLRVESFCYVPLEGAALSNNGTESRTINAESVDILRQMLGTLGVKEQFVLRAYFGLVADPMSLRQIASVLGVCSERVRQIKSDALGKLRRNFRSAAIPDVDHIIAEACVG